ncbi:MBL fold metallo-hydrolase [Altererythrobacter sp. B11]|uniref:MBL fold metallo-hydrolase n=1 Tax=Altererythrobacter sp. B11 TaxID=2060312 RepID=UPI000DC6F796|nr:MBL fold metallo-hydrolase [Altererythrobacter sp. B11]BBC72106.1 MBL fold metallo-hydrolase [Altererythrobacter sp. B11]
MALPPKPWPTGHCEQLEPLVRRVLAPNGSPFTFTGTQTYLIGTEEALAVLDPGPDEPTHLAALERAIGDARVIAICCTHTHRDHSPAAAPLAARTGAPIVGCAPLAIDSDEPRADAPFDHAYRPDRVLADGDRIHGPGWTLAALATPGHTSNHLCFALEESGALFTGDHVMGWSTTVVAPPDGDMGDYMRSLLRLHEREDRIYYPAHGPAVERPRQLVRGMIGHRRQRERQILRLLEEGPRSVAEGLVPAMYKGVAEVLWPAAGQSVRAHLIDLERRGQVARSGDLWAIAS